MDRTGHALTVLRLAQQRGLLRARDLTQDQIPRATLGRLVEAGQLVKVSRGVYALPNSQKSEHQQLAEIAIRVPNGIFCLLTALGFHCLTTQLPSELWLAIPNKARAPRIKYPPLRLVRFSGSSRSEGIETHTIDGVEIRVYSVAKTVVDCFRYRNKVGLGIAIEALRECLRERRATVDELWQFATLSRVENVMRPYLDSTV